MDYGIEPDKYFLWKAVELAKAAHRGQTDRAGIDYFEGHVCTVAKGVDSPKEKTVAFLHDVVEDTDCTLDGLRGNGFSEEIVEAVDAITKRKGEPYRGYLERVKGNDLARAVKISDLLHNMDLTRLPKITEKDIARNRKYLDALKYLMN